MVIRLEHIISNLEHYLVSVKDDKLMIKISFCKFCLLRSSNYCNNSMY